MNANIRKSSTELIDHESLLFARRCRPPQVIRPFLASLKRFVFESNLMFKQLRIYSIAIVTLVFCSSAYGQLFYGGFTHSNGSNNSTLDIGPNVSFELFLEGGELPSVDALELSISLGSAATNPPITNLSGLGIFSDATVSFTPTDFGGEALLSIPNAAALNDNTPVAEVFFDTTRLSDGDTFIYSIDGAFIDGVSFMSLPRQGSCLH